MQGGTDNGAWTYTYDGADRLTTANIGGVTTTYGYDEAGNRTSVKVGSQAAVTTTYSNAGVPTSSSDGTTYSHDSVGNVLTVNLPGTNPDKTYGYDSYSRTKSATVGTTVVNYKYDALSRTIERNQGGAITTYAYSGQGEDVAKATAGATVTTYAHNAAGPLAQKQGTAVRLFVKDLHGDVVGLTSTAGAVVGNTSYSPWGERRSATGESSYLGFQGDPTDATTGLVDMTARNYDPTLGRFVTRDVLFGETLVPMTLNQYVYGGANPVTMSDPTGLNYPHTGGSPGHGCKRRGCPGRLRSNDPFWGPPRNDGSGSSNNSGPSYDPAPPPPMDPELVSKLVCAYKNSGNPSAKSMCGVSPVPANSGISSWSGVFDICNIVTLGSCSGFADAWQSGNWVVAGVEAAGFIPWGKITKLSKIFKWGDRARDATRGLSAIRSAEDVLRNPGLLSGKSPAHIEALIRQQSGWKIETLGKGAHQGQGWVLREYTEAGDLTGRLIRWHPGGGRHGPDPYWRVSSPEGGISDIIPGAPW